jgi:hypothetical protein
MKDFSRFNDNTCILLSLFYTKPINNKSLCHLKYIYYNNLNTNTDSFKKEITTIKKIKLNKNNPFICINVENETNHLRKKIQNALKEDKYFERTYDDGRKKSLLIPTLENINRFIDICESFGVKLYYSPFKINNGNLVFDNKILVENILQNREIDNENDPEYHPDYSDEDDEDNDDDNDENEDDNDDNNEDDDDDDDEEEEYSEKEDSEDEDIEEIKRTYGKRKNIIDDDEDEPTQTYTKQQKIENEIIISDSEDELQLYYKL